jgi:lactam utilization protein B
VIQILEHEPHLHAHTEEALDQVLKMVIENKVVSKNGKEIDLKADTICPL